VDVRTGRLAPTAARWTPGGWWTYVAPAQSTRLPENPRQSDCGKYSWTYP
jgi:hypothetical protein